MKALAVVSIAALDLRRHPSHRSELRSQLLLGELVSVRSLARGGQWARIENHGDGYRGWARTWGLRSLSEGEAEEWKRRARWRVAQRHVEVRSGPGGGSIVTPLFWNSAVAIVASRGAFSKLSLPDGSEGWVPRRVLRASVRPAGSLMRLIRDFHGIPYLWGGRTPLGFDCSGFVQQVMAAVGLSLPRDAHEQFLFCRERPITRSPRPGDLLFFGRRGGRMTHVAIALGGGSFGHARGTVRVNSLLEANPLYDKVLARSLRAIGRPEPGLRHSC